MATTAPRPPRRRAILGAMGEDEAVVRKEKRDKGGGGGAKWREGDTGCRCGGVGGRGGVGTCHGECRRRGHTRLAVGHPPVLPTTRLAKKGTTTLSDALGGMEALRGEGARPYSRGGGDVVSGGCRAGELRWQCGGLFTIYSTQQTTCAANRAFRGNPATKRLKPVSELRPPHEGFPDPEPVAQRAE